MFSNYAEIEQMAIHDEVLERKHDYVNLNKGKIYYDSFLNSFPRHSAVIDSTNRIQIVKIKVTDNCAFNNRFLKAYADT